MTEPKRLAKIINRECKREHSQLAYMMVRQTINTWTGKNVKLLKPAAQKLVSIVKGV